MAAWVDGWGSFRCHITWTAMAGRPQRPEHDAMTPVLDGGGFRRDSDPGPSGDDREPVIDVSGLLEPWSRGLGPQIGVVVPVRRSIGSTLR